MKYDRTKKWDALRKVTAKRTFQQGYQQGYQEWAIEEDYLRQHPKDTYVKGFLQGRKALKRDKMEALITGEPMPTRFNEPKFSLGWDDLMQSFSLSASDSDVHFINELGPAAQSIADAIDEDLIKNG